jgi:hypothetical protein
VEGDLGSVLDAPAKAQYRRRLAGLRADADEAEAFRDPERAAPAYLTDTEWDAVGEDWLEQALAYLAASAKASPGP